VNARGRTIRHRACPAGPSGWRLNLAFVTSI